MSYMCAFCELGPFACPVPSLDVTLTLVASASNLCVVDAMVNAPGLSYV